MWYFFYTKKSKGNVIKGKRQSIDNIINAVGDGKKLSCIVEKLEQLNDEIVRLEEERNSLPVTKAPPEITEEMLRAVIHTFADRVRARDREDCKRFIKDFVDSVIVYEDKIEVNLKISSEIEGYRINRTVSRQFLPTVAGQR